ncbi:PREDICTED: BUD13 homolog, partial [Eurypyga helias]|uniref:BUD13 homolog n=1 Tax=Eurypyga helias TaxID=54383 RepID=UPI00052850FE
KRQATPDLSPPRKKRYDSDLESSPPRRKRAGSPSLKKQSRTRVSSPPRRPRHDSESPSPRRGTRRSSDSDLSPPRRTLPAGKDQHRSRSPPELSAAGHRDARASPKKAKVMFSGVKAGLVSAEVLRREQQELRRHERNNKQLE